MRWATRMSIDVSSAACAWVIRREVDPIADFLFVSRLEDVPAGAIPFDLPGARLGRTTDAEGVDTCTAFETVLRRYDLIDPTLWRIAEIVHQAELFWDERYHAPEARGLSVVVRGLNLVGNPAETLAATSTLFDGLYRLFYYQCLLGQPRDAPV
jgi:hypothetical protein